eukprot:gene10699-7432_t
MLHCSAIALLEALADALPGEPNEAMHRTIHPNTHPKILFFFSCCFRKYTCNNEHLLHGGRAHIDIFPHHHQEYNFILSPLILTCFIMYLDESVVRTAEGKPEGEKQLPRLRVPLLRTEKNSRARKKRRRTRETPQYTVYA